jgi:hypothetical protein
MTDSLNQNREGLSRVPSSANNGDAVPQGDPLLEGGLTIGNCSHLAQPGFQPNRLSVVRKTKTATGWNLILPSKGTAINAETYVEQELFNPKSRIGLVSGMSEDFFGI